MATKKKPGELAPGLATGNGQLTREGVDLFVQKWTEVVKEEVEMEPPLPVDTLLGEGADLAELIDHYFRPSTKGGRDLPGLESVAARGEVTADTARELRELVAAIGSVNGKRRILLEQMNGAVLDRADELLTEFRSTLSYLLEDGAHEMGERQLSKLRSEFHNVSSHDGLATALEGYAELLAEYRSELEGIGGIDFAVLDEAPNLAQALRQRSADRLTGQLVEDQRDLLRLRNRLISAFMARMTAARRAFRFVFRAYPEIAKKAGSEYWRSQRRVHRAQKAEAETTALGSAAKGDEDAPR